MGSKIDLTGQRFGQLVALERFVEVQRQYEPPRYITKWRCRCDCGNETLVHFNSVYNSKTKSCGCLEVKNRQSIGLRTKTHGLTDTPIHKSWQKMRYRCFNSNHEFYHRYGGRGITISKRWLKFENFYEDMKDSWFPGATLDRKNNDGNYCKRNCQWLSRADNTAKQGKRYLYKGKSLNLQELSEETGISYFVLKSRTDRNWSLKRMITQKVRKGARC